MLWSAIFGNAVGTSNELSVKLLVKVLSSDVVKHMADQTWEEECGSLLHPEEMDDGCDLIQAN